MNEPVAPLERVLVVGSSCCGKTTFARSIASALDVPHVELDALYWSPNWVIKPLAEFRESVRRAAEGERWVVDGNYSKVRDLLWPRATSIVWLNFGFATVWGRACSRTLRRSLHGERLYGGNRETLGRALGRDSILLWVLQSFARRRRDYRALREGGDFPNLTWIELRSPKQAHLFLHDRAQARWGAA